MRHSIIRRSLILTTFYVAGHGFYYLLLLIANAMLDPTGFGRLYTGWAVLNVLVAPISIIALLLSSYFAETNSSKGPAFVSRMLARIAAIALPWTAATVLLLEVLFYLGGRLIGVDSLALILVLPLTAISFLGVEIVRASLQGTLRFVAYGASWFLWCAAQCAVGAGGLLLTRSPWGCFAGMLVANLLTFGGLCWAVAGGSAAAPAAPDVAEDSPKLAPYSLRRALAFCSAFVGFVLFNNADIFLAYLILSPADLGVYTASSVLPKAIVTATQPVVQIILARRHQHSRRRRGYLAGGDEGDLRRLCARRRGVRRIVGRLGPGMRRAARYPVLHVAADAAVGRGGGAIVGHPDSGHSRCRARPLLAAASAIPCARGICRRDDADKGVGAGREPSSRDDLSLFLLGIACGLGRGGNF